MQGIKNMIELDFQKNALCSDLETVPGITRQFEKALNENRIKTSEELVGRFFMCNRDTEFFIDELQDYGLSPRAAKMCANAISEKFNKLWVHKKCTLREN